MDRHAQEQRPCKSSRQSIDARFVKHESERIAAYHRFASEKCAATMQQNHAQALASTRMVIRSITHG